MLLACVAFIGLASIFTTVEEEERQSWLDLFGLRSNTRKTSSDYALQTRDECRRNRNRNRRLSIESASAAEAASAALAATAAAAAAVQVLGCSELCLLRDVLGHDGSSLACVNFDGQGGAALAKRGVADPCGWTLDATTQGRAAEYAAFLADAAPRTLSSSSQPSSSTAAAASPASPTAAAANASSSLLSSLYLSIAASFNFGQQQQQQEKQQQQQQRFGYAHPRGCCLVELHDGVTVPREFTRVLRMLRIPVLAPSAPADRAADDITMVGMLQGTVMTVGMVAAPLMHSLSLYRPLLHRRR
jgi:hypothetical protein